MGLMDSDSEDEAPKKKTTKPTPRKSSPVRNMAPTKEAETQENNDQDIINNNISTTAKYIAAAEALMAQPIGKASREQPKKKPTATKHSSQVDDLIELSDEEEEREEEIAMPGTDIEDLDPELAALMNESTTTSSTQPLKVTVRLHYVHSLEVTTERAQEILKSLMKPVKVILMDNEQFRKVLDSYCAKKNLKSSDVVLTYNDDQIFLSGTPAGLGMDDTQIYNMHVYSTQSYSAMLEKKKQQKLERMNRYAAKQVEEDDYEEEDIVPSAPPVEDSESEKILLKLRGKDKKDITLRVRPTATLSSLLNSYKQHAGVTGNVNLSFEGEVLDLDLTIEDTELEDEDLIEVVQDEFWDDSRYRISMKATFIFTLKNMKVTFILLSTAASFFLGTVHALDAKKIKAELMKGQIIPDGTLCLPFDDFEPTADFSVTYGEDILLENGDALQSEITITAPRISFTPKNDTEYTLAMINLDSNASQIVHWMTSNIHGKDLESGNQLATYRGPILPPGSANHRVVYALFEQENKNAVIPALEDRKFFNVKTFAAENNLKLVNAAYFYAQPREFVETTQQDIKQTGLLGSLFDNIGDLVDDLDDIVGINIGNDYDDDYDYDDDDDDDDEDEDDDDGRNGLHIGIDLNDGVHIGVGRGRDGKISSVVRSSARPTAAPRSSGRSSEASRSNSKPRPTGKSDPPSRSSKSSNKSASKSSKSSNKSASRSKGSSSYHYHYSYSSHYSSHSGSAPTPN
ncbi:hypothetical protein INT47_004878 [Mucor saturninus]|uniref:Ubiquitin-like domain-containing protein n=1 Tax=Mucor saturninus TaxID=64648 RepID=A0A8H7QRQ5_9FUNG|nr:hypothetical protein INT47_004878 [Mucor saturninus]